MKVFVYGISIILLFLSCENDQYKNQNDLTIIAGSICGWCAGTDSIVVTKELVRYEFANCDKKISKTKVTTEIAWADLKKSLDLEEFKKINLNTCYVCADGCDYWVEIRSASFNHRIRYGTEDSVTVRRVKPFLDKVHSIREEFRIREQASDMP